ncbi:MAG: tetratricopeptide repeat protein [Candidatus Adiutrix sp.]|nr:tetratricopeptide repeat protein [Candidatus Adiutrix sp.]
MTVFGPLTLNISGDRLFEGGDLSGALREYERGLALAPDQLNLLNSLGVCQGRLGRPREALATFQTIAALDQDNMMAHYNLGYTHLLAGRLNEAEAALARAAELAPDNFETLFHLGRTALELGHLDRALPALKKAGEVGENRPAIFRLLGEALLLAHDHQAALAAFKKAVKAAPNDAYALSALGALFADLSGDLPVARSLCQRSVELDPTNSLYRQRLGRLLFSLGDFSGAEHHLKMAMEYGSLAPEVHYQLGLVAEETGRREEALSHFEAALARDPAYKPALEKLARPADGQED